MITIQTKKEFNNPYNNIVWLRHSPEYFTLGNKSTYSTDKEIFDFATAENSVDRFSKYEYIGVCNGSPTINGKFTAKLEVIYKIQGYLKRDGEWVEGKREVAEERFPSMVQRIDDSKNILDLEVIQIIEDEIIFEWPNPVTWFYTKTPTLLNEGEGKNIRPFTGILDVKLIPTNELFNLIENTSWETGLSQFYGVYQYRNRITNDCYVGSAYGSRGLLGRIMEYKTTKHGNNKQLIEKYSKNTNYLSDYDFTILEVFTPNTPKGDVIKSEQKLKKIQGSTLNSN